MNAVLKLTLTELRLYLRDPFALFFTLAFPTAMLLMFGAIFGGEPSQQLGGQRYIDYALPSFIGLVIANVALMAMPISLASYRETGVMRRYSATPMRPAWLLASQILVGLVFSGLSTLLLVAIAVLAFQANLPASMPGVVLIFLLSSLSLYALSFILAGVFRTSRSTTAAGLVLFFPMMFLSGVIFPRPLMPEWLQQIGEFNPLTHVIETMAQQWNQGLWDAGGVLVLSVMLVVLSFVAVRVFRWG
jgi:ABC-2 type transport system permease protein